VHHGLSLASIISYAVGVAGIAGFLVAITRYWIDQRRARPIVLCHEDQKRTIRDGRFEADAHITNESASSAFNIRFGLVVGDRYVGWKHNLEAAEPSRVNVLRPAERHPERAPQPIVIPDETVLAVGSDRDPGEDLSYWAYYQGPAGDWWYTLNPSVPSADLTIKRVRSKRFAPISPRNRRLDRALRLGLSVRIGMPGIELVLDTRRSQTPD
jgi:hypothetical protein